MSVDAAIREISTDLDRHEKFASNIKKQLKVETEGDEIGEWNGIIDHIQGTKSNLVMIKEEVVKIEVALKKEASSLTAVEEESKNEKTPSKVDKKLPDTTGKGAIRNTHRRCGKCGCCRGTCEAAKRDPSEWCDVCKKKKLGETTGNRGCKKRQECSESKEQDNKRRTGSVSALDPVKRKAFERSPEHLLASKKSNVDSDGLGDDTDEGVM